MKPSTLKNPRQRGFAVAYVLIIMILLAMISTSVFVVIAGNLLAVRRAHTRQLALNIAEAGVAKAIYELTRNPSYSGETRTPFNPGEFSIEVTPQAGSRVFSVTSTALLTVGDKEYRRSISAGVRMERIGARTLGRVIQWIEN